jgi:hypothetical protein
LLKKGAAVLRPYKEKNKPARKQVCKEASLQNQGDGAMSLGSSAAAF